MRVLAVGQKGRTVEEVDRAAEGHDGEVAAFEHGHRTRVLGGIPGFENVLPAREHVHDRFEFHRGEAGIEHAAQFDPDGAADAGFVGLAHGRRIHYGQEDPARVILLDEGGEDSVAVPGGPRGGGVGRVGEDDRALELFGRVDGRVNADELGLHLGAAFPEIFGHL